MLPYAFRVQVPAVLTLLSPCYLHIIAQKLGWKGEFPHSLTCRGFVSSPWTRGILSLESFLSTLPP